MSKTALLIGGPFDGQALPIPENYGARIMLPENAKIGLVHYTGEPVQTSPVAHPYKMVMKPDPWPWSQHTFYVWEDPNHGYASALNPREAADGYCRICGKTRAEHKQR